MVAWRIDKDFAIPVAPDEDSTEGNCIGSGVLLPDGRVVNPFMQTFADEAAWAAAMAEQAAKESQPLKAVSG